MQIFTEPTWSIPELESIDLLCRNGLAFKKDPYIMTGFITQWLRTFFKDADNIQNTKLKEYLWNIDPIESRITIDPSFYQDSKTTRRTPAIHIKRATFAVSNPGMVNGLHSMHAGKDGYFRGQQHTAIISGSHAIQCVGSTEAEAENLGVEVFDHLLKYTTAIKYVGHLGAFTVSGLTETSKGNKGEDFFVTAISVSWHYSYDWTIDIEAPILKEIGLYSQTTT